MDIFTERFKEFLRNEAINQAVLANSIGIARQCITDYKSGKSFPSIQTLSALCRALDVSADYLLGLEDETRARVPAGNVAPMGDALTEKEAAMLEAFRQLLPETQDFILKSVQSFGNKKSVT